MSFDGRQLTFGTADRRIIGHVFEPADASREGRGVMFIHGQGSDQKGYEDRARRVVEQIHATCLTFDLSGHGRDAPNYGRRSVYDHLEDAVLAYEQLVSNPHVDRSFDHRVRE